MAAGRAATRCWTSSSPSPTPRPTGPSTRLALEEVRGLLADRLQGRPTRTNFRTGHLTVCTLHPMRSVPHRVVCLLGLDDGAFPRKTPSDGDDLMLDRPQIGERNPRTEDLQLLLDAVLAATERLIVAYTSNDERTNLPRPPAVPVGELLDTIDATARREDGDAHDQVVVHHPCNHSIRATSSPARWCPTPPGALTASASRALRRSSLRGPDPARSSPGPWIRSTTRCSSSTSWCGSPSGRCGRSCGGGCGSA